MTAKIIPGGTVHELPSDLRKALVARPVSLEVWRSITPLARNEWICWTITVKQAATRKNHIERTVAELAQDRHRPCCWVGCIHRTDKEISPSVRWVLSKRPKKS